MVKKEDKKMCCCKHGFPTFAVIVLVVGVLWLLADLGVINANIPWFPIILIIVALGMIVHPHTKKE